MYRERLYVHDLLSGKTLIFVLMVKQHRPVKDTRRIRKERKRRKEKEEEDVV